MVKMVLKFEGLAVFFACLFIYVRLHASLVLFALLWLLPDISMIGYLKSKKFGAIAYNTAHNYLLVIVIIIFALWQDNNFILSLAIILASHIGLDRFLGYGLKYVSGFKDTHIQRL
jgi:hypothetical protein